MLLALIVVGLFYGYISGFFFKAGIFPCFPPPGLAVDGIAIAKSFTWNDLNGNGNLDKEEPPLAWVTIDIFNGDGPSITGADGKGSVEKFKPGCVCGCWISEEVSIVIPPGFKATTPTQLKLRGENITYNFGFIVDDSISRPYFSGEPEWYQAFINRGLAISAFHYTEPDGNLMIALSNNTGGFDREQSYGHIFNIIDNLEESSDIGIRRLQITTEGHTATCKMNVVRKWVWKISYTDIISSYCKHSQ